jgi:hypothetical protein
MSEGLSPKEADLFLPNTNFINLSASNFSMYERAIILPKLLKGRKIKNVIYSLDINYILHETVSRKDYDFSVLYDENPNNDYIVYTNFTKWRICFKDFGREKDRKNCDIRQHNVIMDYNIANLTNFGLKIFLKNEIYRIKTRIADYTPKNIKECDGNFEKYKNNYKRDILKIVKDNPKTNFYIFATPYSRAYFATMDDCEYFYYTELLKYIVKNGTPNLFLYAFENEDFLDNLDKYRDLGHYDNEISSFQIKSIGNGKNLLTKDNIDKYIKIANRKRKKYDLKKLDDTILTLYH